VPQQNLTSRSPLHRPVLHLTEGAHSMLAFAV
jgi:hypothetical protein